MRRPRVSIHPRQLTSRLITLINCSLDLTAASKAYIMEPQWNPMVEEQALDRVHRFGQTEDVTTVRYVIKDTWEEVSRYSIYRSREPDQTQKIIALQKKKRALGQYMFFEDDTSKANPSQSRLQVYTLR